LRKDISSEDAMNGIITSFLDLQTDIHDIFMILSD